MSSWGLCKHRTARSQGGGIDLVSEMLADFVRETSYDDIPVEARDKARRCFLDWLGCVVAGSRDRSSLILSDVLSEEPGSPQSEVIGEWHKDSMLNASMINAAAAHALELDDLHKGSVYHPGAPVIAAALAVGEKENSSLADVIRAIVLGYETSIRIGEAVSPTHYRFWHTTGTVGTFGSAVAASVLLGSDRKQIVWALGNAGTQASGLWEFVRNGAMSKTLHCAKAAFNGILAALLAKRGFTGADTIFEGDQGFCRATSDEFDLDRITHELGTRYRIEDVAFKVHASCGHTHSAVDATLFLRESAGVNCDNVRTLTVYTYPVAVRLVGTSSPRSSYAAKFSLPICLGIALKYGDLGLNRFVPEVLDDPDVLRIAHLTELALDERLTALYPGHFAARVVVETSSGDRMSREVVTPKGEPPESLTDDELTAKFVSLTSTALGREGAAEFCHEVITADQEMPVRELIERLRRTGRE